MDPSLLSAVHAADRRVVEGEVELVLRSFAAAPCDATAWPFRNTFGRERLLEVTVPHRCLNRALSLYIALRFIDLRNADSMTTPWAKTGDVRGLTVHEMVPVSTQAEVAVVAALGGATVQGVVVSCNQLDQLDLSPLRSLRSVTDIRLCNVFNIDQYRAATTQLREHLPHAVRLAIPGSFLALADDIFMARQPALTPAIAGPCTDLDDLRFPLERRHRQVVELTRSRPGKVGAPKIMFTAIDPRNQHKRRELQQARKHVVRRVWPAAVAEPGDG